MSTGVLGIWVTGLTLAWSWGGLERYQEILGLTAFEPRAAQAYVNEITDRYRLATYTTHEESCAHTLIAAQLGFSINILTTSGKLLAQQAVSGPLLMLFVPLLDPGMHEVPLLGLRLLDRLRRERAVCLVAEGTIFVPL